MPKGELLPSSDFFLGFSAHAHTRNELITDPEKEVELRRRNSPKEAQKLTDLVLNKLERDISESGCDLKDVRLLILFLSYRGGSQEKDKSIIESIMRTIEKRLRKYKVVNKARLIGHTTAAELENEDLVLKEVTGIGYNGLSLLALVSNLPIGIGRTWGLQNPKEAKEQGEGMTRDAWFDLNHQTTSKQHLHLKKNLLVLTQGPKTEAAGFEHFLAEGIANFMGSTREASIMNVVGGSSGDGLLGEHCRQFYGKLGEQSRIRILDGEAVCALIPNLRDVSIGLDVNATTRIGKQQTFHFNPEKEPYFKYITRISGKDPSAKYAEIIYENEAQISQDKGQPILSKDTILKAFSDSWEKKKILVFHPIMMRGYAFAFPHGNYSCNAALRVVGDDLELLRPVRCYTPKMLGYVVLGHYEKVQRGARNVYDMLRTTQGFNTRDATILITCVSRRLSELMAGRTSGTEAEVLRDGLSSTQMIGFLAYGELSFTYLLQEPYQHIYSCWGITFHSTGKLKERHKPPEDTEHQVSEILSHRIPTGFHSLDHLLFGGILERYAVMLTAASCDERDLVLRKFLKTGAEKGEVTFYMTTNPGELKTLPEDFSTFYLYICNPQADKISKDLPNVFKLKGIENLTNINIALNSAFRTLNLSPEAPRRICIEIVSDVLLHHGPVQTRRWLTALIPDFRSRGFTTLAVMDPGMHSSQDVRAVLDLFQGEIGIYEKETEKGLEKFLKIKKMTDQKYSKSELPLQEEKLQE